MKMKNRSDRYHKNRLRARHEHKYSEQKKCLTMMMLTYDLIYMQDLSNIWSSIHEKVKQHWNWVEKKSYE